MSFLPKTTHPLCIELSDAEKDRLGHALADLRYPVHGPYVGFVRQARVAFTLAAPPRLLDAIESIRTGAVPPCAVVIDDVPCEPGVTRGPVDIDDVVGLKLTDLSEALLIGATSLLGDPYGIRVEGASLVNNVAPVQAQRAALTGLGSDFELSLHIENAALRHGPVDRAPDGLALTGLSPEPSAPPATKIADARVALRSLSPRLAAILREPRFAVRVPGRWRDAMGGDARVRTPLVTGGAQAPSCIIATYGDMTEGLDVKAQHAYEAFRDALEAVATPVVIMPGRLVLVDNHFTLHGRTAFKAAFDDEGRPYRWLQRTFWKRALRDFGTWPRAQDQVFMPTAA